MDDFAASCDEVKNIDILKLDVQGAEWLVLKGASSLITQRRIKVIYAEIICVPTYDGQKSLGDMLNLYRDLGFELFNFYSPMHSLNGRLQQFDAIFTISDNGGVA